MRLDRLNPKERSELMRQIRSKDTGPELEVRRLVHKMGYWYRLYQKGLPGRPDMVFPSRKKVIFIHGCFWHGHLCKAGLNKPRSNKEYWEPKLKRNIIRDQENRSKLKEKGWDVLEIWECQVKDRDHLSILVQNFLN